jgi:uncharacterized protein (TIGR00251 family)
LTISVKVVPRSSRNAVVGWIGESLKVCVTAPADRGKANAAVVETLARALDMSPQGVRIVAGPTSRRKLVELDGIDDRELRRRFPREARRV